MKLLNNSDYNKVKPLLDKVDMSPTFAYAVIDGKVSGSIYVDDTEHLNSVFIGTRSGIYFIVGSAKNEEFNQFFQDYFYENKKGNHARFTLFSSSKDWDVVIGTRLMNELNHLRRKSFTFDANSFPNTNIQLSEKYVLRKIDKQIVEVSPEYGPFYYKEYWDSVSNFLKHGIGYCILYQGDVACECKSIYVGGNRAEIDIQTEKDHRGKGLAFAIAHVFIKKCLKNKITPKWDCDSDNLASQKLAEKLGFQASRAYSIYSKRKT